jgi:UDP-glucose 4-epimerase
MTILLTGSSGTIGTRLFEKLIASGYDVVGVDRRENTWSGSLDKKTVRVDLLNPSNLRKLPRDADLMIHFAANARVYELVINPEMAFENITMTSNLLEFARKTKVKKIIFSSSREVYGNLTGRETVKEDDMRIANCESPYAASKISCEAMIQSYHRAYGVDFAVLRFSNVYGMYDNSDRVVPLWIGRASRKEDLVVFGENKILDFTYIDDTVEGVIRVLERFGSVKGETFNIASGKGTNLSLIASKIKKLVGSSSKIVIKDGRPGEVWKFTADISKAKTLLQYEPKTDIDDGLLSTVRWYENLCRAGIA